METRKLIIFLCCVWLCKPGINSPSCTVFDIWRVDKWCYSLVYVIHSHFSKESGSSGSAVEDSTHLITSPASVLSNSRPFLWATVHVLSSKFMTNLWTPPLGEQDLRPSWYLRGGWSASVAKSVNFPVGVLSPSSESDGQEFLTSTPTYKEW